MLAIVIIALCASLAIVACIIHTDQRQQADQRDVRLAGYDRCHAQCIGSRTSQLRYRGRFYRVSTARAPIDIVSSL